MAHLFKVKTTKPIPSNAEIVAKNDRIRQAEAIRKVVDLSRY